MLFLLLFLVLLPIEVKLLDFVLVPHVLLRPLYLLHLKVVEVNRAFQLCAIQVREDVLVRRQHVLPRQVEVRDVRQVSVRLRDRVALCIQSAHLHLHQVEEVVVGGLQPIDSVKVAIWCLWSLAAAGGTSLDVAALGLHENVNQLVLELLPPLLYVLLDRRVIVVARHPLLVLLLHDHVAGPRLRRHRLPPDVLVHSIRYDYAHRVIVLFLLGIGELLVLCLLEVLF